LGSALILFLIFRTFIIQAFRIPSESMEDTLLVGDFLFVSKLHYGAMVPGVNKRLPGFRDMERGDVVVFKNPVDRKTDYIKRCVAIPGDTVQVRNNVLFINGDPQDEPYVKLENRGGPIDFAMNWPPNGAHYVVPEEHFFAMGDNRLNSQDSRFFDYRQRAGESAVPKELVVGKAMFIYASFDPDRYYLPRISRMLDVIH
jgi:signal peptidase I